jgi:hypothetical protein
MRVIGHHEDKGGRSAVCELLDWTGSEVPSPEEISRLPIRNRIQSGPYSKPQFFLAEARKKKDKARLEGRASFQLPAKSLAVTWGLSGHTSISCCLSTLGWLLDRLGPSRPQGSKAPRPQGVTVFCRSASLPRSRRACIHDRALL